MGRVAAQKGAALSYGLRMLERGRPRFREVITLALMDVSGAGDKLSCLGKGSIARDGRKIVTCVIILDRGVHVASMSSG